MLANVECFCGHDRNDHTEGGTECLHNVCDACRDGRTRRDPDACECYDTLCDCPGFEPDEDDFYGDEPPEENAEFSFGIVSGHFTTHPYEN